MWSWIGHAQCAPFLTASSLSSAILQRVPEKIVPVASYGESQVEEVSSSTSGLYTLSVNKVGDLPIIVPSLAEQGQIIAEVERRLSVIEALETAVEANLTRADRLRQSVLKNAFSGKLFSLA